jgi:hypothetical protein
LTGLADCGKQAQKRAVLVDLQIETEVAGDILLATCTGIATAKSFLRLLLQVCDIAAEKRVQKVLFNGLAISGSATTLERYEVGVKVSEHLLQHKMDLRIAFVGVPPTFDGFAAEVARNREVVIQVFPTVEAATAWLGQWSNLSRTAKP